MDIDKRESLRVVTSNSFVTAKGLGKLSLKARKLLYIAISQCKQKDNEFYQYEIGINEFAEMMGVTVQGVYSEAKSITEELLSNLITIETGTNSYRTYVLFTTCYYNDGNNKKIIFKINPDMTDFFLKLRGDFSKPLLEDFLKMKSPYSIAIWHLIQKKMKSKKPFIDKIIKFDLDIEELREITDTKNKLKQIGEFKKNVFDKALREISDNCCVDISYDNIKIGRTIVGFRCYAKSSFYIDESHISPDVKERTKYLNLKIESKKRPLNSLEQEEYEKLKKIYDQ